MGHTIYIVLRSIVFTLMFVMLSFCIALLMIGAAVLIWELVNLTYDPLMVHFE